jgi:hypothetical protein
VIHHYLNVLNEQVNQSNNQTRLPNSLWIFSGIPPDNYISFFGMRGYDILMGKLVSKNLIENILFSNYLGHWNNLCSFEIDDCWWSNVYLWISEYQWSFSSRFSRFGILFSS